MTCNEGICFTFGRLGKSGDPAEFPQTRKIRLAASQQLMDIRLMANIKDQTVVHSVVYSFKGHCQFDSA